VLRRPSLPAVLRRLPGCSPPPLVHSCLRPILVAALLASWPAMLSPPEWEAVGRRWRAGAESAPGSLWCRDGGASARAHPAANACSARARPGERAASRSAQRGEQARTLRARG